MKTNEATATPADLDIVPAEVPVKQRRGFAAMDRAKLREIASKGGKQAHVQGTAHQFTSEEARAAGKRAHVQGTAHQFTSQEARAARSKGGKKKAAES